MGVNNKNITDNHLMFLDNGYPDTQAISKHQKQLVIYQM